MTFSSYLCYLNTSEIIEYRQKFKICITLEFIFMICKTKMFYSFLQCRTFLLIWNLIFHCSFALGSLSGESSGDGFKNPANGFGDQISWKSWPEAKAIAKQTGKPIMVILHKESCPACRSFKPVFASSEEILNTSDQFVMVNARFGQEPSEESDLNVDGKYVPRIIFLDSSLNVLKDVINKGGNPKYKYFHKGERSVIDAMKQALAAVTVNANSDEVVSTEL